MVEMQGEGLKNTEDNEQEFNLVPLTPPEQKMQFGSTVTLEII